MDERAETESQTNHATIKIERPKRIIEIEVPFSEAEIQKIEIARQAFQSDILTSETASGSGQIRTFSLDHRVPWGYSLKDRAEALERMKTTHEATEKIIEEPESTTNQGMLTEIRGIRDNLGDILGIEKDIS